MDSKLERMRVLLREEEDKKGGNRPTTGSDKAVYPYWNIPEKQTATVRFLPDKDEDNAWFWAERQTIRLPFNGVVGGDRPTSSPVVVTVPCVDMFGDVCPIIAETRPLWKSNEDLARRYWKKRSYIAQGFVLSSPFPEAEPPENPIRRFFLGFSLLEKLKAGLRDPEMENVPTDFLNGTDFKIKKTRKGDYNNYDTSEWSRRSRPLSEAEQIAIEQHGLWNLSDFKGQRPDSEGIAVIKAMFHASMANEPFDMAAFGAHYKPFGAGTDVVSAPEGVDDFSSTPVSSSPSIHPVASTLTESDDAKSGGPMDLMKALRERNSRV
jgi:hypothetical protein